MGIVIGGIGLEAEIGDLPDRCQAIGERAWINPSVDNAVVENLNPPVRDTIARTEIFRDKIVGAVAPTHPLAGRKSVSLQELAEFPFVLTERSSGVRQQIDRTINRHAINPNVLCATNSITLVKPLVSFDPKCAFLRRF